MSKTLRGGGGRNKGVGVPDPAQEHNQLLCTGHVAPQDPSAASKAAFEYGDVGIQGPVWDSIMAWFHGGTEVFLVTSPFGERSLLEYIVLGVGGRGKRLAEKEGGRERQEVSHQNLSPVSADTESWVPLLLVFLIRKARDSPPGCSRLTQSSNKDSEAQAHGRKGPVLCIFKKILFTYLRKRVSAREQELGEGQRKMEEQIPC